MPKKKDEQEPKIVHITCHAKAGCDGTNAVMMKVSDRNLNLGAGAIAGGGKTVRYRCQSCNGVFVIGW